MESENLLENISSNENQFLLGMLFLLIMGFSLALVPVILYPIAKKYNESLAIGYVVFRGALETFTYMAMAICWLSLVVLSKDFASGIPSDTPSLLSMGHILSAAGDRISSLTSIVFSLGALMLYYLLFQSNLIPKWLSGWGLIAGLVYLATGVLELFGTSLTFAMMPIAVQEMVMAVWLILKGFNPIAKMQRYKRAHGLQQELESQSKLYLLSCYYPS